MFNIKINVATKAFDEPATALVWVLLDLAAKVEDGTFLDEAPITDSNGEVCGSCTWEDE